MAAEDEGRTEEPSEYKLEKERKEGRVAKSSEVASSLVMLLGILLLLILGKWIFSQCINVLTFYFNRCAEADVRDGNLASAFFVNFLKMVLPIPIVGMVAAFFANIVQTRGFIFSWKPIEPKFNNIVPNFGQYFKRTVFSRTGLFNIVKSFGKVFIIGLVGYLFIKRDIFVLIDIIDNGQIVKAIGKIASMAAQIVIIIAVIFLGISIPDFFVQKSEFKEQMKMTKQEVKEEYKEMEGDPEVKNRLKSMQQELLSQNIPQAVKESNVVITNPTHFAVALKYDQMVDPAPKVMAKGEDNSAFYIRRLAKENNVPIVEDRPLARVLYTETKVGDIIPDTYWNAIAIVYSKILKTDE